MSSLLRGGRITSTREDVVKFTSSIKSDRKLLNSVIKINQANVVMMVEQKIIKKSNGIRLLQALSEVKPKTKLKFLEDVHMAIEEEARAPKT